LSAPRFDALVAIGDNLSIDAPTVGPLRGAASLLLRNRDAEWPEFRGRDIATRDPGVRPLLLGQDGATLAATLSQQMKRVPTVDDPVLVVVTVGGRDLLNHIEGKPTEVTDGDTFYEALTAILDELGRRLSEPVLFIGNLPSPGGEESPLLAEFNAVIADTAREQGASLIDIHAHFQGHGPKDGDAAWLTPNLEPTPEGASEIRRLFWQALTEL
jgi:hypothetical protein